MPDLQGVLQALPRLEVLGVRFADDNNFAAATAGPAREAKVLLRQLMSVSGLHCRLWVAGRWAGHRLPGPWER